LPHKKNINPVKSISNSTGFCKIKKNCWLFPTIKSSTLLNKYDKEKKKVIKMQKRHREEDILNFDFESKERPIKESKILVINNDLLEFK
jgi:hypothetical protein